MTYDIKLDLIFNTIDPVVLRKSIEDNYLVRKGVTTLIDSLRRSSIVTFDAINKEWMDRDRIVNTMSRTTLLPFSVARIRHDMALSCSCTEDYAERFHTVVGSVVDAYMFAMIPIMRQQQIDQLEADLIPLEQQQRDALNSVQDASVIVVDDYLEDLKGQGSAINEQIDALNITIVNLTAYQSQVVRAVSNLSSLWGLLNKNNEETRQNLLGIVRQQNIYANELTGADDIRLTLVVANARLQNLTADKALLDQNIEALEQQNAQVQQARELTALRNLSTVTRQITDIRNQLAILRQ